MSTRTDPRVADWLASGGWQIEDGGPQREARSNFDAADLDAVTVAVLDRIGVTPEDIRRACLLGATRRVTAAGLRLPPQIGAHMGVTSGDSVEFRPLPDGRVELRRAPDVDVSAVRARMRASGASPGLLARLLGLPKATVWRVMRGGDDA